MDPILGGRRLVRSVYLWSVSPGQARERVTQRREMELVEGVVEISRVRLLDRAHDPIGYPGRRAHLTPSPPLGFLPPPPPWVYLVGHAGTRGVG